VNDEIHYCVLTRKDPNALFVCVIHKMRYLSG